MVASVIFDAFGTLLRIKDGAHPYRQLMREGVRQGRRPQSDDAHLLMTQNLGLREAATLFGIQLDPRHMRKLQQALDEELASICAFEDGLRAVELLQCQEVSVAICSNLAAPYAAPIKRLYPRVDAYGFSFELGMLKPDVGIYQATYKLLELNKSHSFSPENVVMIGDSPRCDRDGPREAGIQGFLLSRAGVGDFKSLTEFASVILSHRNAH